MAASALSSPGPQLAPGDYMWEKQLLLKSKPAGWSSCPCVPGVEVSCLETLAVFHTWLLLVGSHTEWLSFSRVEDACHFFSCFL